MVAAYYYGGMSKEILSQGEALNNKDLRCNTSSIVFSICPSNDKNEELGAVSDASSTTSSTCPSNDSDGELGTVTDLSINDDPISIQKIHSEVPTPTQIVDPSCAQHVKPPRQPIRTSVNSSPIPLNNRQNWNQRMQRDIGAGFSFEGKPMFLCVEGNKFVPRSVQLNAGRPNFNSVRPNINTGRTNINSVRPKVNVVSPKVNTVRFRQPVPNKTSNSSSPKRPQMNQMNQRRDFSKSYSSVRRPFEKTTAQMSHSNAVMGSWGSAVKTSASYNWRNSRPNFHYNSGPTFNRTEHPLKNMVDRGIFDSGCSGHMTGNKDQLEDFEEFNGGSVTFGGSKGYISGKGRIRVGNLDFDSVSFVKELGHFNLFSISQICDKQHKVPRHHNMYSFDMKTPTSAKAFACLIAKATSNESKLWHRSSSQTPSLNASEEKDEDVELIVVPSFVRNTEEKAASRKSYTNSKKDVKNIDRLQLIEKKDLPQLIL
ncbi:hypothetical protein Tco_1502557 [Tanacetum coccineum]